MREVKPVRRHPVATGDGPERDHIFVCSGVPHDANGPHGEQYRERLPDVVVETGAPNLLIIKDRIKYMYKENEEDD